MNLIEFVIVIVSFLQFINTGYARVLMQEQFSNAFLEQKLDHFDRQNRNTWQMRYTVNDEFAEDGAPILIFVKGRNSGDSVWTSEGLFFDIAQELNATLYGFIPRYYDSVEFQPTEDLSVDNLRYLTTDQTLADLAHFVEFVRSDIDTKVIVAGLGYGGNLAALFRQKYPHYVNGIWSSRGSLEGRLIFDEYFQIFEQQIRAKESGTCVSIIRRAFRILQNLINGGRLALVSELFQLCEPLSNNPLDVTRFFQQLSSILSNDILLNGDDRLSEMCFSFNVNPSSNEVLELAAWLNGIVNETDTKCINANFESALKVFTDPEFVSSNERQRLFQSCSEFGQYVTSNSRDSIFAQTISIDFFVEACSRVFGELYTLERMQDNINQYNMKFGGVTPMIDNAIFVNAARNPMSSLNVNESSDDVEVFNVSGGIYDFSDLQSISEYDNSEIREIKERIRAIIINWATPSNE
jgi:hypothetical protein